MGTQNFRSRKNLMNDRLRLSFAVTLFLICCAFGQESSKRELFVNDFSPNWSPDGSTIAFVSQRTTETFDNRRSEIYTIRPDGSNEVRLTDNDFSDSGSS